MVQDGEFRLRCGIGQAPKCGMEMGTGLKTKPNEKPHEYIHTCLVRSSRHIVSVRPSASIKSPQESH
jgi:hypothetical protein